MQLIVASWIPFGIAVAFIWIKVLGFKFNFIVAIGILLCWYFWYLSVAHKFKKLKCPECGEQAFGDSPSILTKMKCLECGFQNEDSLNK